MALRIGLLIDSFVVPVWQQRIISYLKNHSASFSFHLVVVNESPLAAPGKIVYKVFRKVDRLVFPAKHDCFNRVSVKELLQGVNTLTVRPVQKKFTDTFPVEAIDAVRQQELDVIIRFGFRILKGDILHAAKHGVWSLHHGDNAVNRGGPPAFWEVVKGEPVTGVTLQVLSEDLDGGTVIDKAFIRTNRTAFNRNQNELYWAGVELFCSALTRLVHAGTPERSEGPASPYKMGTPAPGRGSDVGLYSKPLYKNPGNVEALFIFSTFWLRRIKEIVIGTLRKPGWGIYYAFKNGGSPRPVVDDSTGVSSIETSLFRYKKLTSPHGVDWADPFVVKHGDKFFLFFEELLAGMKKAQISCLEFDANGKQLSGQPVVVLKEQHHLSYPFMLGYNGNYYMIPEAAESKSVWRYECEQFPTQWKRSKELLSNVALYDPTVVFHDGYWYLVGTQKPFEGNSPDQYLYIYFTSDFLNGTWQAHPMNPVTRDVRCARPAGKIFTQNGKLIRPVQLGAPNYGYGISFFEIVKLSPTEFEQLHVHDIMPHWRKGLRAAHTFNTEEGFAVVDAQG